MWVIFHHQSRQTDPSIHSFIHTATHPSHYPSVTRKCLFHQPSIHLLFIYPSPYPPIYPSSMNPPSIPISHPLSIYSSIHPHIHTFILWSTSYSYMPLPLSICPWTNPPFIYYLPTHPHTHTSLHDIWFEYEMFPHRLMCFNANILADNTDSEGYEIFRR